MSDTPIITMPPKLVGEELIYSADFSGDLGSATIVARSIPSIAGGTVLGAVGGSGALVSAMIGGGAADDSIVALYEALTSDGQRLQCYLVIPVYGPPAV